MIVRFKRITVQTFPAETFLIINKIHLNGGLFQAGAVKIYGNLLLSGTYAYALL